MITSLDTIFKQAQSTPAKKLVVAAAENELVIKAVINACNHHIIVPIFIGNANKIKFICDKENFNTNTFEIIDSKSPEESCHLAVKTISEKHADILMKGLVNTGTLLKAVLDKDSGIRHKQLMSHVSLFQSPYYYKLLGLSDVAMNIAPTLQDKVSIIDNAVDVFKAIGYSKIKVALLAATETINPKMQATIDASSLSKMNEDGQIKNCIVKGPLAFDNAISNKAAILKGIDNEVAGDADLLIVHDINVGNSLYKAFNFMGGAVSAAVVMGAMVPIVLTSRADSEKSKLFSIALAKLLS